MRLLDSNCLLTMLTTWLRLYSGYKIITLIHERAALRYDQGLIKVMVLHCHVIAMVKMKAENSDISGKNYFLIIAQSND